MESSMRASCGKLVPSSLSFEFLLHSSAVDRRNVGTIPLLVGHCLKMRTRLSGAFEFYRLSIPFLAANLNKLSMSDHGAIRAL